MKSHVCALVGAQYGSEGKGTIAYELASEFDVHVRVGAPNAGHTIRHEGQTWKMRSVPCGWVNPDAYLVIGAGALIDLDLLIHEVEQIEAAGYEIRDRLLIDEKAQILLPDYHNMEGGTTGIAHLRIGSTGEGVGPARMAKIARGTVDVPPFDRYQPAGTHSPLEWLFQTTDTVKFLDHAPQRILLEGTQGSGLSLTHGEWPYCTSVDTNVAQMLSDTGIAPRRLDRVILVARTFPIRVAGNSGPLRGEMTWGDLGRDPEHTTVTLKERRVGMWDSELVRRAALLNGADEIALTFMDYIDEGITGVTSWDDLTPICTSWIDLAEEETGCQVTMVGVGGPDFTVLRKEPVASRAA